MPRSLRSRSTLITRQRRTVPAFQNWRMCRWDFNGSRLRTDPGETKHSNFEKAAQFARVVRVLKLAERLGLDLPDSFAGYRELLSDLFQGMITIYPDAKAHPQDALLARRQAGQHLGRGL